MNLTEVTLNGLIYTSADGAVLLQPFPPPYRPPANAISSSWDPEAKEHTVHLDDGTQVVFSYASDWWMLGSDPLIIHPTGDIPSSIYAQDRNTTVLRAGSGVPPHDTAWQKGEIAFDAARNKLLVAKAEGRADEIEVLEFGANKADLAAVLTAVGRTAAPKGVARMVSMNTGNVPISVQHDGTDGATGICYAVTGGTPVYAAVAANTSHFVSLPHKSGAPLEIWVWPSSAANGGVRGNLTIFSCAYNFLTSLDVSGLTALTHLYCHSNALTSLDVSGLTALTTLDCYSNFLTSLDVSGLTALTTLDCSENALTSLDVSGSALTHLYCHSNALTSLDVSGLGALTYLYCHSNALTSLRAVGLSSILHTVDLSNMFLSAEALNQFFTDLGTSTGTTLNVAGNPGAATCDPTIATAKGWVVTTA